MRIVKITEYSIEFDNGKHISFDHDQECCEINYADFEQFDSLARDVDFIEPLDVDFIEPLTFESCDYGFRFGNPPINMFFVPCYSIQNGYYSSELDIWYDGKEVIHGIECPIAS